MPNRLQKHTLDRLEASVRFREARDFFASREIWAAARGLFGSSFSLALAGLAQDRTSPWLIVTAKADDAEEVYHNLIYHGLEEVFHYPKWDILPYEDTEEPVAEIRAKQVETLGALLGWRRGDRIDRPAPVIVAPYAALMQKTLPPDFLAQSIVTLAFADTIQTASLAKRLAALGYERTPLVESRGEFSIRGGIVDIFPIEAEEALRIDLFGEEIESIRKFDVFTQRSIGEVNLEEPLTLLPCRLHAIIHDQLAAGAEPVCLTDYLTEATRVVLHGAENLVHEAEKFQEILHREWEMAQNERVTGRRGEEPLAPERMFLRHGDLQRALGCFQRLSVYFILPPEAAEASRTIEFDTASFDGVAPDLNHYISHIHRRQVEDFLVTIVCDNDGQANRLREILGDHDIGAQVIAEGDHESAGFHQRQVIEGYQDVVITVGDLSNGCEWPQARLCFITDREIFGRYRRRHVYRKMYKGRPIGAVSDIQREDLVIHVDHGLGRYTGLRSQEVDGRKSEFLEIQYADGGRLLVPIDKARRVQKFVGVGDSDVRPNLDKLGGKRWDTRKKKTEKAVEEMAAELLELYARRATAEAWRYGDDTVWQTEFEASFIYQETPDQLKAIDETKQDMMSEKPMDRLVCGDVGFGKTEVAIRAAFKAVQDGKQVAVLAPTTILAQQHFNNFRERFADYPIHVETLSRFRTAGEQKKAIERLKRGETHVVVGTHRLLSKDVVFADLGLLIVDEEQRFGVKQKDKLKEMRASIDILTLSATPIPRTLHMALSGIRDMSLITTPPADRRPIKTRVIHFDKDQIAEAILRELNRGGQVYFVHNRVHNIEQVAQQIQEIVPRARIAIGHGQMNDHELEQVMAEFINGEHDILLATTIIENGLDIPNVNTIIINRADAFGLAQLYQLRGRVGRDVKQAYAYLVIPSGQPITDLAVKRLQAIEEFTELGVGFNIAMRDMEIRGVGNLLGARQHGAMEEVGFELYCEMLEQAVRRMRGESTTSLDGAEVKWGLSCMLPVAYVPIESQRIALYKRLAGARTAPDLDDIGDELRDRYGELPPEAANLLAVTRLRILAAECGFARVQSTSFGFNLRPMAAIMANQAGLLSLVGRIHDGTDDLEAVKQVKASASGEIGVLLEKDARADSLAVAIALCERLSQAAMALPPAGR